MDTAELITVLLSWAVTLSAYDTPAQPPAIEYRPHSFFVDRACAGRECKVLGWYNDQDVVYIDERFAGDREDFATSLIVHELIHFLQDESGHFDHGSCEDSLRREREAYRIQKEYLVEAVGSFRQVGTAHYACGYGQATEGP